MPDSYAGIDQFAQNIGRQPNIVMYYGSWLESFRAGFADMAAQRKATTLVQISTGTFSLASIANGQYDNYLRSFADQVKAFGRPIILSLDHEMNGDWYPWGYRQASPADFVAAWQHVVTIFRGQGAINVTWMWTVNITTRQDGDIVDPRPWWPGSSYVNWVGIDGYYYGFSQTFASLFGQIVIDVRELTHDPILIAETGAAISAGQATKISDLFNGVRVFGLLGFVLFDVNGTAHDVQTWRISSGAAYAALRDGVDKYMKPDK